MGASDSAFSAFSVLSGILTSFCQIDVQIGMSFAVCSLQGGMVDAKGRMVGQGRIFIDGAIHAGTDAMAGKST